MCSQGDISCGSSSHPDFIKNYFLSSFLKLPLKFSVASHPGWQNGTINVTQCVAALNIFTHQSQLFTLRQEDHLLPLVVSRSDRAQNLAFQKKTKMNIFFPAIFPNLRTQRQLAATGKTFSNVAQQSLKKCTITRFVNLVSRFSHKTSSVYFPAGTLRTRATREHFNGASGEMIT